MTDEKRTFAKVLMGYFEKKPGQVLADFAVELKELTEEEKIQLADGIEDGTLTY